MIKSVRFTVLLFLIAAAHASTNAQVLMRDMLAKMPVELMPQLTLNNRLDMIDFAEAKMESRITDKFDTSVTLDTLSAAYLHMTTSSRSEVSMLMLDTMVCVVTTVKAPAADSSIRFYDLNWQPVDREVERPAVDAFLREDIPADVDRVALKGELEALPLMCATILPESASLQWQMSCEMLSKDMKKVAEQCLRPVVIHL